ncbi:MAG TPA: hypothetical protein VHV55_18520 [Pirellulales bacterium]|nr:hypothetical protein [Pirellulales bacterium]
MRSPSASWGQQSRRVMPVTMYRPCRNCGERIPLALSECPYCGTFAPAAGMFGRGRRRLVILSVIGIVCLLAVLVTRYYF